MKVIVAESKIGVEYIADVISSCDQNGIECIVDDQTGDILYYEPKLGKYGDDKLLQNSDESIFDLVKDKERLAAVLKDAQGDEFKQFAVQWNDLQKKGEDDEVYKTQHCNPIRGNFAEKGPRNTRPLTAKDREEFEKFRKRWKSLGKKKDSEEEEDYVDDFGMRVNGIEAQVSESDDALWDIDDFLDDQEILNPRDREFVKRNLSQRWGIEGVIDTDNPDWSEAWDDVHSELMLMYGNGHRHESSCKHKSANESVSEHDDPRDWSASEGEVEIVWNVDHPECGIEVGDTEHFVVEYDDVVDNEYDIENNGLRDEVCRLIREEYPEIDLDEYDFDITNEREFWGDVSGSRVYPYDENRGNFDTVEGIPNWAAYYIEYGEPTGEMTDEDIEMVDEYLEDLAS